MELQQDFLPVLLGSDMNVYGMARSFHQAHGYISVAIGKNRLGATSNSKIVTVEVVEPNIEDDAVFVKTLMDFRKRYPESLPLLLVPCGDNYIKLLVRNQDALREAYRFACMDEALLMRLSIKENFYAVCRENGFLFPKTTTCTPENYREISLPFDFPVIIKPSNSVAYWNCKFPHKKKVFKAENKEEFDAILQAIYASSYQDHLIIQEFIPGDDTGMRVMNCYCGTDKKVRLMALGQVVLEEHSPEGIGSYAAILSAEDAAITEQIRAFLEKVGYVGFINIDMKFDPRDGKYKLFEMNLRQGRSSFFVTALGYNLGKYLAEDVIYHQSCPLTIAKGDTLWTVIPDCIIKKFVQNEAIKRKALQLIKEKKVCRSLLYEKDRSAKRLWYYLKNQLNYIKKYNKYFNNKGLHE